MRLWLIIFYDWHTVLFYRKFGQQLLVQILCLLSWTYDFLSILHDYSTFYLFCLCNVACPWLICLSIHLGHYHKYIFSAKCSSPWFYPWMVSWYRMFIFSTISVRTIFIQKSCNVKEYSHQSHPVDDADIQPSLLA